MTYKFSRFGVSVSFDYIYLILSQILITVLGVHFQWSLAAVVE